MGGARVAVASITETARFSGFPRAVGYDSFLRREGARAEEEGSTWRSGAGGLEGRDRACALRGFDRLRRNRPPSVRLPPPCCSSIPTEARRWSGWRTPSEIGSETSYGGPVDLQVEFLDLPDASIASHSRRLFDLLSEKYATQRVHLVTVVGLEGLRFVLEKRAGLFPAVPVVFTNIDRDSVLKLGPLENATGAYLKIARPGDDEQPRSTSNPRPGAWCSSCGSSPADKDTEAFVRRLLGKRAACGLESSARRASPRGAARQAPANLPREERGHFHELSRRHPGPVDGRARRAPPGSHRSRMRRSTGPPSVPRVRNRRGRPDPVRADGGKEQPSSPPRILRGEAASSIRSDRTGVEPARCSTGGS